MKDNIHEIIIKIEKKEWEEALNKSFIKNNKKVKIDGFRQGKAPRDVFEKKYGKEYLYNDAIDMVMGETYKKVLDDNNLEPVIRPSVDIVSVNDEGCEFKFVITTKPAVTLGSYTKLNINKDEVIVTEEEIEKSINDIRQRYVEIMEKDGSIENGDLAIIDFEGFKDDVAFDGGKGENHSLEIGSNSFIPGFEEGLIGLKKGDKKDLNLSFPDTYHVEDLKGKEVVFKVEIKEVKEKVLPEYNDDFFKDLDLEGIKTKEDLENLVKEQLTTQKEYETENNYIDNILKAVAKDVKVDIPEEMIDEEVNRILGQYEENLKMQGIDLDMYLKFTNSTIEVLKDQMKEEATSRVTYRLMLEEIYNQEKFEITKEEVEIEAEKLAEKYKMKKDEFLQNFGGLSMVEYDLKMRKTLEFLKENN